QWAPRSVGASRTLARLPTSRVFFHAGGLERRVAPLVESLARPLPSLRPAPRALAESLIDAARVAMATRQRELHAFSHPNPDDVLLVDGDRGVRLAFVGLLPGFRLPLEGYYAFLALKNGVPVAYGAGWELFGTLDFAVNVFASFRQGESASLGVTGSSAWPTAERRAFARLSLVAALIVGLETWSAAERRQLVRVFRAKGSGSERAYVSLLDSHRRLRRSLEALIRS